MDFEHLLQNCNETFENGAFRNESNIIDNGTDETSASVGIASLEQPQLVKYALFFYVLPFIAVVGILGNTLSLSVLQVTRRVHAFNVYLMALTSADVLLLIMALSRCVVLIVARYPEVRYPALNIYGEYYLSIIFGGLLQRISATLISIISIERFVAVAFPFKLKLLSIEKHPLKIILFVIVANILCQLPTVFLLDVVEMSDPVTNATIYGYSLRFPTPTLALVRQIYLVFLAVIGQFIPLLIVVISTTAILLCLKMRSPSLRLSRTSATEAKEWDTMTFTLVSMAIIFTLCYIPAITVYIISAANSPSFKRRETYLIAIIVDINIVTVCLNSASDFLIYFFNSKKFRELFVARFSSCSKLHRPSDGSSSSIGFRQVQRKGYKGSEGSMDTSTSSVNVSIVESFSAPN